MPRLRVGVVFGGRSGEHEVSLASAASVIAALEERGHTVVPIGIARTGRWVVGGDPLRALAAEARVALPSNDADGAVKKALANRAEAVESAAVEGLARTEPAGSLPLELRQGLDVVVIMLHGPYGEDGTIQGLFELADVPYVGAGVLASAVGMDKATMKAVFQSHGLPIVEHLVVTRHEWRQAPGRVAARVAETVGFPCFVKPVNLGSSVGISKVPQARSARRRDRPGRALRPQGHHRARGERARDRGQRARQRRAHRLAAGRDQLRRRLVRLLDQVPRGSVAPRRSRRRSRPKPRRGSRSSRSRRSARSTARAWRASTSSSSATADACWSTRSTRSRGSRRRARYAKMWAASGLAYTDLVDRLIDLALERHQSKGTAG